MLEWSQRAFPSPIERNVVVEESCKERQEKQETYLSISTSLNA